MMSLLNKTISNQNLKEIKKQFIKFIFVGVLSTLFCFSSFYLFTKIFFLNDKLSNIISYFIGIGNSYIFNKLWTFESKVFKVREFILFFLVFFISFGIQIGVYSFIKEILNFYIYLAFIAGMFFYTATNFTLNKLVTFKN